ncbi:DDB1- and CUL4-associated factor 11-like [Oppia nitens]|uniref:DDB1- and CUL4-associated factor 11-like n=1 Tax=Oppia nitens TaxID=1686743 RepID=UPI0023DBF655|nr:DDB1- and CUL4-associated factor 11-like [Oppia nitens]
MNHLMGSHLSNISDNNPFVRRSRLMSDIDSNSETAADDSETDADLNTILRYLIRRGHIRFIRSSSSSNDDDSDTTDDSGYVYQRSNSSRRYQTPIVNVPNPDTSVIDESDLKLILRAQTGLKPDKPLPPIPMLFRNREIGVNSYGDHGSTQVFGLSDRCKLSDTFLPNKMSTVEQYPSKAFCGFYSKSGDLFLTACQDTNIRIYDTKYDKFKLLKTVWARDVGWSVLDTDFSPNGTHFIYSSWSECIHICNIYGDNETHEALSLSPDDRRFCIFSLRFSQNGSEILGGANDKCLYVYNRECKSRVLKIRCHEDDVNSVAFADSSSQILFSAGDDGLCKVWDRRTLNETDPKPVGTFSGHVDGITYIDSKGDGRHLITNSKDQSIKLWDMRCFSPPTGSEATRRAVSKQNWDYRWQAIPRKLLSNRKKIEGDTSLMTYMGHSVLQTLIRCHFSPEWSTGQRYIYTGCSSGKIVIYDVLSGKIVKTLSGHRGCVRDVSFHPYDMTLMSSSWDGTIIKWIYADENALSYETDSDTDSEFCRSTGLRRSKRLAEKRRRTQE